MRIGAAELAADVRRQADQWGGWVPDVLFATSLIGLGDLIALLPREWRHVPSVLYMHENQLAYPVRKEFAANDDRDLQFAVTNAMSMLVADRVVFNSRWNMDSFLGGIDALLGKSPDNTISGASEAIAGKSDVAWPPVEATPGSREVLERVLHNVPVIVWPHRWEHDKGPSELLETARSLRKVMDARWIILGEQFADIPEPLSVFLDEFQADILHAGHIESRADYLQILASADWVLSTADHEFFGVAVVEAMLMGCLPWLPERLSYPELVPDSAKGLSPLAPPDDPSGVRAACVEWLSPCLAGRAVARIEQVLSDAAVEST